MCACLLLVVGAAYLWGVRVPARKARAQDPSSVAEIGCLVCARIQPNCSRCGRAGALGSWLSTFGRFRFWSLCPDHPRRGFSVAPRSPGLLEHRFEHGARWSGSCSSARVAQLCQPASVIQRSADDRRMRELVQCACGRSGCEKRQGQVLTMSFVALATDLHRSHCTSGLTHSAELLPAGLLPRSQRFIMFV